MSKSSEYWKGRFEQLEDESYKRTEKYIKDVETQFREAQNNITLDIERWYRRLADNNEISLFEARKLLKRDELEEFHWSVEEYIKKGQENSINEYWMKELENASAKVHIRRLEAMKFQMQQHAEILYTKYCNGLTDHLHTSYANHFYRSAYEIQKGTGVGSNLAQLDTRKINKVLTTPWAADGKNFSDRIWNNKERMVKELHRELTQSIIRADDPQKAINNLARILNTSKNNTGRLIMTEMAAVSSTAQKDCFDELDVEEFEIVATLDDRTSEICREMDGKHFPMSQYEIGVTAPPFHVRCRTVTVPYFEDDFGAVGQRAARGEDGKTYYVPADMTYREWEQKFVKKEQTEQREKADYLIRANTPGQNITKERKIVNDAIAEVPPKVQKALNDGTVIDVGKTGASQYDYKHDILYVAKGATKEAVIHEIGHMIENKLMKSEQVAELRKKIIGNVGVLDVTTEIYADNLGNETEIFLLKNDNFVSEYQGRIYIENIFDAFEADGTFKDDLLWEFISESFRIYVQNPMLLKEKSADIFAAIEETMR